MGLITQTVGRLRTLWLYSLLFFRDRPFARQLELTQDNLNRIASSDIILFCRVPQDTSYLEFFLDYYRKIGVKHFMFIDSSGVDTTSCLAPYQDVSVWRTKTRQTSNFDVKLFNVLLYRYGIERWNLVVDPYEFIVYPNMKTRNLKALGSFLDEERRFCMHTVRLDAHGDPTQNTDFSTPSGNLFDKFPLIDTEGYFQDFGKFNSIIIKGGPVLRVDYNNDPEIAPNLDRISFIKWKRYFHYNGTTEQAWPIRLNRPHSIGNVSTTGALISFNWILEKMNSDAENARLKSIVQEAVSTRFSDAEQLIEAGLMTAGEWF